jgi:predicted lipoprotein with Yx(FWY)xxD motif
VLKTLLVTTCIIFSFGALNVAEAGGGKRVKTGKTRYGTILQDSKGRTLYLFTRDRGKWSNCYGECARVWPPLMTSGSPVALKGAKQSELGTTKRRSGKSQVTYNGHPLYYYVGEDEPNEVLCQAVYEFDGWWYVVNKDGKAITKG